MGLAWVLIHNKSWCIMDPPIAQPDAPNDLVSDEGHADCKVANNTKTDEEAVEYS